MTARAFAVAAGLGLILSSCGDDARAGEIGCQRRLVELSGDFGPVARGTGLAGHFSRTSARFGRMPLDGCTEAQRSIAGSLARVTRDMASRAARIGDPLIALERPPELRASEDFRELQSLIEQRRQVLREDLERMTRDER